jgi:transposase
MTWRTGQAYSQDLRDRVLAAVDGGLRVREVAPLFRVSISYIYKALERRAATGETRPCARGGARRAVVLRGHEAALLAHLRAKPDATLGELRRWLLETRSVSISVGALWNGLDRLGWTLKKSRNTRPSRSGRTSPQPAPNGAASSQT